MTKQAIVAAALAAAMGLAGLAVTGAASADNIFRTMNPFKWFFGDDWDDDYDYPYHYWRYGWGDPYGWNGPWAGPGDISDSTVIVVQGQGQGQSPRNSAALASVHTPE